jgi:hypothetical protein
MRPTLSHFVSFCNFSRFSDVEEWRKLTKPYEVYQSQLSSRCYLVADLLVLVEPGKEDSLGDSGAQPAPPHQLLGPVPGEPLLRAICIINFTVGPAFLIPGYRTFVECFLNTDSILIQISIQTQVIYQFLVSALVAMRIRIKGVEPMRIRADPDPAFIFPSKKFFFCLQPGKEDSLGNRGIQPAPPHQLLGPVPGNPCSGPSA